MDFEILIAKIARILSRLKIKYFVTGGYAVAVWGRLRATFDIDVVIAMHQPHIPALAQAMRTLGKSVYVDEDMMRSALILKGEFNIIHPESGIKIDFFIAGQDPRSKLEFGRAKQCTIQGQKIYFISPEDLILSKLRWYKDSGGEHHLEDARSVIKKSDKILDYNYLETRAEEQAVKSLWEKLK